MNDFDWDVLQKKRIARGAAHMKRGSKSKKCSLPSDRMTAAEWKRRNGTVNTYNMNLPMSWGAFKMMPPDLQQSYIDRLQERFGVSLSDISKDLFDCSIGNLRLYANRHGLKYKTNKGQKLGKEETVLWNNWLNRTEAEVVEEDPEPAVAEIPAECFCEPEGPVKQIEEAAAPEDVAEEIPDEIGEAVAEAMKVRLTDLTATFKGEFDTASFMQWVSKLPMPDGLVKIRVEVEAL